MVPPYRVDVTREADILEEVLRIYGFNNVEVLNKVNASLSYAPKPDEHKLKNMLSDVLSYTGFNYLKICYHKHLQQRGSSVSIGDPFFVPTKYFQKSESIQKQMQHFE